MISPFFDNSQNAQAPSALMGIVNVTPDSFSDGNQFLEPQAAVDHALRLVGEGATFLDLGAEASSFFRPGVTPIPPAEQIRRLRPVLTKLVPLLSAQPRVWISVDTREFEVARAVLDAGAHIINDISAGTHDPDLLEAVARQGAGIILMHMDPGYPATPERDDADIIATVRKYLQGRAAAALAAGIAEDRIALDPGLGFGKTMADNWRLALGCHAVAGRYPLVLGVSRKRFLETPLPPLPSPPFPAEVAARWENIRARLESPPGTAAGSHPRDGASAALTALVAAEWPLSGPPVPLIHRVHNVTLMRSALTI